MLKFQAVNRFLGTPIIRLKDLIALTVCNSNNLQCIKRECEMCGVNKLDQLCAEVESICDGDVSWFRWEQVEKGGGSRLDKVKKDGSVHSLFLELKSEVQKLPLHDFTHRWQSQQYKNLKSDLPSKWGVITMDFAENYLCRQQDQPQSAYYGYSQVTVHPCVLNYSNGCGGLVTDNFVFVSDVLDHDANMVHVVTEKMIEIVKDKGLKKIVIFSDGCSAQYKSKLPFFYLNSYVGDIEVERCYFGARHGKNPCDALGGVVKQATTRAVQARQVVIQNALDFFTYCTNHLCVERTESNCSSSRNFFLISASDIPKKSSDGLKTLPGTMKLHSIIPMGDGVLSVRELSCFCPRCSAGDYLACDNIDFVDPWRVVGPLKKLKVPVIQPPQERGAFFKDVQKKLVSCGSFCELKTTLKKLTNEIDAFPVPKFKQRRVIDVGIIDKIAYTILNTAFSGHPDKDQLANLMPVLTKADGNCVPRAISFLFFGDEDHHTEVRCRIVQEMVLNDLDYLSLDSDTLKLLCHLSDCFCGDLRYTFELEVMSVCRNSAYMGMWQLMAAANVFKTPICSVYPSLGPDTYISLCNQVLKPRSHNPARHRSVNPILMWSSLRDSDVQNSDLKRNPNWTANHVVPLMPMTLPSQVD